MEKNGRMPLSLSRNYQRYQVLHYKYFIIMQDQGHIHKVETVFKMCMMYEVL